MISKLLVIHQGAIGDLLLASPAIWSLYTHFRPKEFYIAGHPWATEIFKGIYEVSGIYNVDVPPFSRLWSGEFRVEFELAVVFSEYRGWVELLRKAGTREVWLLPPFPKERVHLLYHHCMSLQGMGISAKMGMPSLFLTKIEIEWAKAYLEALGITGPFLAVHPSASSPKKVWPVERMAYTAHELSLRHGLQVVLVQGPIDERACCDFLKSFPGKCHVFKELSLRQLGALLYHSSLFIGNDSGVAHLAAASGTKVLVIFGPTDPVLWTPLGRWVKWIWGRAPCSPCGLEERRKCEDLLCLKEVKPERVAELAEEMLYKLQSESGRKG